MKKKHIVFLLFCFLFTGISAQTLEQAKAMFAKGEYQKVKPVFQKYVSSQPANGPYNLWYGVCCLKTGDTETAVKYLESAVKKRVPEGELYLGQAYYMAYRFEEASNCLEGYIKALEKRKQPTEEAEQLLEKSKAAFRMLKGVEKVCIIDSFTVNKNSFLDSYKISEESGKLFTFNDYFKTKENNLGTVYETEIGNKLYYSEKIKEKQNILTKNKLMNEWSQGVPLPANINTSGNANYPYILMDGVTLYYATDSEGLGGYDIFVTRYNTNNESYLTPENVGMPFNSPFNDYMYVIDEYNNLGWFASDRYQPENKVCIYVFIPNSSKQIYDYEATDPKQLIRLAQIYSLKETWKGNDEIKQAKERLEKALTYKPQEHHARDFEFVINDNNTYYQLEDFKSSKAKQLFQKYEQQKKDLQQQENLLNNQRQEYARAGKEKKAALTSTILDLEKKVLQMSQDLDALEITIRNTEINTLKQ